MFIDTTINVNCKVLEEIAGAAFVLNVSRSDVIVLLLKLVMERDLSKTKLCKSVKYQKSTDKCSWHKFHIRLLDEDYECFLDLRKFLKLSVSYLVAFAVKKYIKYLINGDATDNYQLNNYVLVRGEKDCIKYWQIIWGDPTKLEEYIPRITKKT